MAGTSAPFGTPGDESDSRLRHAPATERNSEPITGFLKPLLPPAGLLLEIGSGTGQHAVFMAQQFPALTWQTSDTNPEMRDSIMVWIEKSGPRNINPPLELDVTKLPWPIHEADLVFSANMIHITPWSCCQGLMKGAGEVLDASGLLVLYGPFMKGGQHSVSSNAAFDDSLRGRDPAWGIRDLDEVAALAEGHGFDLVQIQEMPANNLAVQFRKKL